MTGFELFDKIHSVGLKALLIAKKELGLEHDIKIDTFFERNKKGGRVDDIDTVYVNVGCTEFLGLSEEVLIKSISLVVAHEVRHIWQIEHDAFEFEESLDMEWADRPHEIDAEKYAWSFVDRNENLILA